MSFETFPEFSSKEQNPAIQLFGKRFFTDQTTLELLIELLLLVCSPKRIGGSSITFNSTLPDATDLSNWEPFAKLNYSPRARLNLKLFAFMGASRLDSRHETHREHYRDILQRLHANILVSEPGTENDVLRTLENLFLGFQGVGAGRTWCAQSFLPICNGLLATETIWSQSVAKRSHASVWSDLAVDLSSYFSSDKRIFLARGGEVLYLQICNALRQGPQRIQTWAKESGVELEPCETTPSEFLIALEDRLNQVFAQCPDPVNAIAEFIDTGVDSETAAGTDQENGEPRFVEAGFCPEDSWREGYLFAVDVSRLCQADLDLIERLQMLETACAMQVLRSLAMQSARHTKAEHPVGGPGYRLAITAPGESNPAMKLVSRQTSKAIEKLVYRAIRTEGLELPADGDEREKVLKEADRRYGGKLFNTIARRIGLLVPRRGGGVRFTLNERLLRFLVVTTVPIGGRLTYASFKKVVEARHGLVFDLDGFRRASKWVDGSSWRFGDAEIDTWLQEMLEAAGLLLHLSDSCALVVNPATKKA